MELKKEYWIALFGNKNCLLSNDWADAVDECTLSAYNIWKYINTIDCK